MTMCCVLNKFCIVGLAAGGLITAGAVMGLGQPGKGDKPAIAPAKGEQPKPGAPKGKPDMPMHKEDKPGEVHAKLMKLAGAWDVTTTTEIAGMEPMESKGMDMITTALDGRFLHENGAGDMQGQTVRSFKVWGYDNNTKKYEGTWTWTLSTGLLHVSGESKDGGKTIDSNAWYTDEGGKKAEFKVQHTFTDDDHFSIKMYGGKMPDGSAGPTMTSKFTRKK